MKSSSRLCFIFFITAIIINLAPGKALAAPVTITWSVWGGPDELASHQAVAKAYMEQNPDVVVKILHWESDNYQKNLKALIATGEGAQIPDVIFLSDDFEKFSEAGVLENLSPWIEKSNYNLADYWPDVIQRATIQGGVYGFQRDLDLRVLYYNKDMFDAIHLAYPDQLWTWDDWANAAEKLTVTDSNGKVVRYGLGMEAEKWNMLALQNGAQMVDNSTNPSKCALDQPKGLQAVDFFASLLNKGYAIRPKDLDKLGGDGEAFLSGKVAMILQNSSRIPTFNKASINYDVSPVPIPKGGKRVNNSDGARFVMSSRSLHKVQAWDFLRWLQSADGGQKIYTLNGDIFPALRTVAGGDTFLKQLTKPANRSAFLIEAVNVQLLLMANFPDWNDMNDAIVTPGLAKIWNGDGKPDEIVGNLCDKINAYLIQNGYPKAS